MLITLPNRTSPIPANQFAHMQPSSAGSLRKILLDYLETDAGNNPAIDGLLSSDLLLRYFKYVSYSDRELVFDIGDASDQVRLLVFALCC